jgi:hypothetical protein
VTDRPVRIRVGVVWRRLRRLRCRQVSAFPLVVGSVALACICCSHSTRSLGASFVVVELAAVVVVIFVLGVVVFN